MKVLPMAGAFALALNLAACGESQKAEPHGDRTSQAAEVAPHADPIYSASGTVTAVAADQVTISHGPVAGLGWPAMTMTFGAGTPELVQGLGVGDRVAFEFLEADGGYTLTSITEAQ